MPIDYQTVNKAPTCNEKSNPLLAYDRLKVLKNQELRQTLICQNDAQYFKIQATEKAKRRLNSFNEKVTVDANNEIYIAPMICRLLMKPPSERNH